MEAAMRYALKDLDTALFLDNGKWTPDPKLAQQFDDPTVVEKYAFELNIRNAEVVMISGKPPEITGGFCITRNPYDGLKRRIERLRGGKGKNRN